MKKNYGPVEPTRAFWTVILTSYCVSALLYAAWILADELPLSLAQPNTTQLVIYGVIGSLFAGFLLSLLSVFLHFFAALNVAAGIAALIAAIFGRVPFLLFLCAFPICAVLIVGQYNILPTYHFYTALPEEIEWSESDGYYYRSLAMLMTSFFLQFLCSWIHLCRFERRAQNCVKDAKVTHD